MELTRVGDAELVGRCRTERIRPGQNWSSAIRATCTRSPCVSIGSPTRTPRMCFRKRSSVPTSTSASYATRARSRRGSPSSRGASPSITYARRDASSRPMSYPRLTSADEDLARLDEALVVREALATLPDHCFEVVDRFFTRDESYQRSATRSAYRPEPSPVASRVAWRSFARSSKGRKPVAEPSWSY